MANTKLCLNCRTEQRARKNGRCPNCGEPVFVWRQYFLPEFADNPGETVLRYFIQRVRELRQLPEFSIPKKSSGYRRELKSAIDLWETCGSDTEVAQAVTERALTDRKYAWREWTSLAYLANARELPVILAEVLRERKIVEEHNKRNAERLEEIAQRQNIFDLGGNS